MVLMANPLTKIFGSKNDRELRRLAPVVDQVNSLEPKMRSLSDAELAGATARFRQNLDQGATLDEILPEAFAVVREVSVRTLGMRPFDVQMIGGHHDLKVEPFCLTRSLPLGLANVDIEQPQEFALCVLRYVTELVYDQRTAMGQFGHAGSVRVSIGKRTSDVTE